MDGTDDETNWGFMEKEELEQQSDNNETLSGFNRTS